MEKRKEFTLKKKGKKNQKKSATTHRQIYSNFVFYYRVQAKINTKEILATSSNYLIKTLTYEQTHFFIKECNL